MQKLNFVSAIVNTPLVNIVALATVWRGQNREIQMHGFEDILQSKIETWKNQLVNVSLKKRRTLRCFALN